MKTFLSIGSGPGIGLSTAERFAAEGFRIILSSRNHTYLDEQVSALQAAGHTAAGFYADAGKVESIIKLVHDVESQIGAIDVLHFNSAAMHEGSIAAQSTESFITDLTTNVGAGYAAVKEASRGMLARHTGTLLLTGGIFSRTPNPDYLALGIGKAGLLNLSQALFESFKKEGVHIATVTVAALVAARSPEARGIAQAFWDLHNQQPAAWTDEITYPPAEK